jgi:hypothetical protein
VTDGQKRDLKLRSVNADASTQTREPHLDANALAGGVDAGRGDLPRPAIMIHIERSEDSKQAIAFYDKLLTYDLL